MHVLVVIAEASASRYWASVLPILRQRGLDLSLVTLSGRGPLHDTLAELGVPAYALGARNRAGLPAVLPALRKLIHRLEPQIVHAHETLPTVIAAVAAHGSRASTIYHRHHGRPTTRHRPVARLAVKVSDVTVAVSHSAAEQARRLEGSATDRTFIAHNGVAAPRPVTPREVVELRRSLGLPPDARAVVLLGRLRRVKGHSVLFDALPEIASRQPVHAVIVGSGPIEDELRRQARAMPVPVHFVGHQEDVSLWLHLADVVVMPSREEPFGLAAIEALACSRALVASRVDGLTEILDDGRTALLIAPDDPSALAAAVLRLLADRRLASSLGEAGATEYAQKFTMHVMAARWIEIYARAERRSWHE